MAQAPLRQVAWWNQRYSTVRETRRCAKLKQDKTKATLLISREQIHFDMYSCWVYYFQTKSSDIIFGSDYRKLIAYNRYYRRSTESHYWDPWLPEIKLITTSLSRRNDCMHRVRFDHDSSGRQRLVTQLTYKIRCKHFRCVYSICGRQRWNYPRHGLSQWIQLC